MSSLSPTTGTAGTKRKPHRNANTNVPPTNTNNNPKRQRHSFQVDDTDHCETPFEAYQSILPVLDQIASSTKKKRSTLRIYDPYYCDGGVQTKLNRLGCHNVIHRNRDFYKDIEEGSVPDYDVLLTNPPYSGSHMERLLQYCASSQHKNRPFLLLLPHFVYTKDYYSRSLMMGGEGGNTDKISLSSQMFYLIPKTRFAYVPPGWVDAAKGSKVIEQGKKKTTAPFPSFWYGFAGGGGSGILSKEWLVRQFGPSGSLEWLVRQFGPSGSLVGGGQSRGNKKSGHSNQQQQQRLALRYANCTKDIPREFKGEFDTSKKRPNPRARKRAAAKKRKGL
ncbi:hypothetical protein ACHAXR_005603 [Thalassiosira sp. AJA248-18]